MLSNKRCEKSLQTTLRLLSDKGIALDLVFKVGINAIFFGIRNNAARNNCVAYIKNKHCSNPVASVFLGHTDVTGEFVCSHKRRNYSGIVSAALSFSLVLSFFLKKKERTSEIDVRRLLRGESARNDVLFGPELSGRYHV
jgi:hypothetical protein